MECRLAGRPVDWVDTIGTVAIDPHQGDANSVNASLGHATSVVDPFAAIKGANAVIDDVRRRRQQRALGHRGHKDGPRYGISRLLLQAAEILSDRGRACLEAGLAAGHPLDEVLGAWLAKEPLRNSYNASNCA